MNRNPDGALRRPVQPTPAEGRIHAGAMPSVAMTRLTIRAHETEAAMKAIPKPRAPLTAAACLLLALLVSGCTTRPKVIVSPPLRCDDPRSRCVDELMQALEDWKDAYNSRDARRLQQLYAPGALITDDEYKTVPLDGEALPQFFDQMAQRPTARMRWNIGNLQFFGETAVRSGEYEFSEQVGGVTQEKPARYSFAYQRMEGRWLIVLQHSTLRP